jgi:hypothetical protein
MPTLQAGHPAPVVLGFPADGRFIGLGRLCIAGVASTAGARIDEIDDLRMAVTEACQWLVDAVKGGSISLIIEYSAEGIQAAASGQPLRRGSAAGVSAPSELSRTILRSTVDHFELVVDPAAPRCLFSKRWHGAS